LNRLFAALTIFGFALAALPSAFAEMPGPADGVTPPSLSWAENPWPLYMQVRPTGTTVGISLYLEMQTPVDMCLVEAQRECVIEYIASTNMVRFPHGFEVSIKRPMAPTERPQGVPPE
jgi:hypothetical protein